MEHISISLNRVIEELSIKIKVGNEYRNIQRV